MSTWIYLMCEDHDPPLPADDESGQHLYDLPQIRADIANRDALVAAANDGMEMDDYFRRHTLRFLRQHPRCHIGIQDEYGRPHPLTNETTTNPATQARGEDMRADVARTREVGA